jgi:hypothetical protein
MIAGAVEQIAERIFAHWLMQVPCTGKGKRTVPRERPRTAAADLVG